jgi:hypothetical protein
MQQFDLLQLRGMAWTRGSRAAQLCLAQCPLVRANGTSSVCHSGPLRTVVASREGCLLFAPHVHIPL